MAHPSLIALIIGQMKQAANELQQASQQTSRGLAGTAAAIFSLGQAPKAHDYGVADLYYQPAGE